MPLFMGFLGGTKPAEPANDDSRAVAEAVKSKVEEALGVTFATFNVHSHATQLVNGINFFLKIETDAAGWIHVRAHRAFDGTVTYANVQKDQTAESELSYF